MPEGIYNEDSAFLTRVKDAVAEQERLSLRVEELQGILKKQEKDVQSEENSIRDEIESTVKKRRSEVEDGYDKQISAVKSKKKKAEAEKEKRIDAGKASRIKEESKEHVEDSKEAEKEMKKLFRKEGVPKFARSKLFYVLFMPESPAEYGMMLFCYAMIFAGCPAIVTCLARWIFMRDASDKTKTILSIMIPAVMIILALLIIFLIYVKVKSRHLKTLRLGRKYRNMISKNDRRIREIKRSVENDDDESIYDVSDVNERIEVIAGEEEDLRDQKSATLKTFDEETAGELKREIEERRNPRLNELQEQRDNTSAELEATEKALQEKSLEISQNYTSRLGEDFLKQDRLEDLLSILQSGQADTISGAIAYYRNPGKDTKNEN